MRKINPQQPIISVHDYNRNSQDIAANMNNYGGTGMRDGSGVYSRTPVIPATTAAAGGGAVLAKTDNSSTVNGKLRVKFSDSDGNETGDYFEIFIWADKRTSGTGYTGSDMDEWLPFIPSNSIIFIIAVGDDYFLQSPLTFIGEW